MAVLNTDWSPVMEATDVGDKVTLLHEKINQIVDHFVPSKVSSKRGQPAMGIWHNIQVTQSKEQRLQTGKQVMEISGTTPS